MFKISNIQHLRTISVNFPFIINSLISSVFLSYIRTGRDREKKLDGRIIKINGKLTLGTNSVKHTKLLTSLTKKLQYSLKIYRFRHILWNNTASCHCTVDI